MTRPAAPPPPSEPKDDFEEMLAGLDRIINEPELQQQLLDAGLLVRLPCAYRLPSWSKPCDEPKGAPVHDMSLGWHYSGPTRHLYRAQRDPR